MSKFIAGQTSPEVQKKKNNITKSMLAKSYLIDSIQTLDDIPPSLSLKNNHISQHAVFRWADDNLDNILSFSRNTAHAKHNAHALKLLLKSVEKANIRITEKNTSHKLRYKNNSKNDALFNLRKENENLRTALAEVYRAYLQIIDRYREDRQVDESVRKLILQQAEFLGKHRLWEVK